MQVKEQEVQEVQESPAIDLADWWGGGSCNRAGHS